MFFLSSAYFFKINFIEKFFQECRVSYRLDPYQAQQFVGSDLGPNCLERLSTDNTRRLRVEKDYFVCTYILTSDFAVNSFNFFS